MKTILAIVVTCVLVMSSIGRAEEATGVINFKNVPVMDALHTYEQLSGLDLVIDSRVKRLNGIITMKTTAPLTKHEVVALFEKTFLEEAGIVVTHLSEKQASVTYNDALPIKQ